MRIFSALILVLMRNILPLILALFAVIRVSKIQSISGKNKIILSIIILFCIFIISNWIWHYQGDFETTLMLGVIFSLFIYIGQVALVIFVIRWIIKTTSISKTFKTILLVIISICVCIMLSNYRSEKIDEKYVERKEIVDNESLIGLSEEQVVALLGEPGYKYTDTRRKLTFYEYGAGTILEQWFWGKCYTTKYYRLTILFDENGIAKIASIEDITDL